MPKSFPGQHSDQRGHAKEIRRLEAHEKRMQRIAKRKALRVKAFDAANAAVAQQPKVRNV